MHLLEIMQQNDHKLHKFLKDMGNLLHALQIQKVQIKHLYTYTVHPKTLLLLYVIYMIITCRIGCINPHPKKRLVDSTSYHRIIIK